jgi:hypothetical protein
VSADMPFLKHPSSRIWTPRFLSHQDQPPLMNTQTYSFTVFYLKKESCSYLRALFGGGGVAQAV